MATKDKDGRSEILDRLDLEAMNDARCGRETDDETDEWAALASRLPAWRKKKKRPRCKE